MKGGSDAAEGHGTLSWVTVSQSKKQKLLEGRTLCLGYPSIYIKPRPIRAHDSPAVMNEVHVNNASS